MRNFVKRPGYVYARPLRGDRDADAVKDLEDAEWNAGYKNVPVLSRFAIAEQDEHKPCPFIGLFRGDELIGLCSMDIDNIHNDGTVGQLDNLYIRHDLRGFGLGTQLVNAALDAAKNDWHFQKVVLDTSSDALYAWFARLGFALKNQLGVCRPSMGTKPKQVDPFYLMEWTPDWIVARNGRQIVRALTKEDSQLITEMTEGEEHETELPEGISQVLNDPTPEKRVYGLLQNGVLCVVGILGPAPEGHTTAQLSDVYIAEFARGNDLGYDFVTAMIRWAIGLGYCSVHCDLVDPGVISIPGQPAAI